MPPNSAAQRVTWLSVYANCAIGISKVVAGYLSNSRALIADGLHSLTDLSSDFAVLLGMSYAARPPDRSHLWGHHKATSLVSLFIAAAILLFCAALIFDTVRALLAGRAAVPHWPALAVAVASVIVKEWLYHRTVRIGRETKSSLIITNAWHHRTDSVTSIVAAVGIAVAIFLGDEWAFIDAVIGILLGGYLAIEGMKLVVSAIHDLMDAAPAQPVIDDLREHILPTPGAVGYHDFRARRVGDMIEVSLHLLVPPDMTVEQGHDVATEVRKAITERHPEVIDVLIHIEPNTPEHQHQRGIAEVPAGPTDV